MIKLEDILTDSGRATADMAVDVIRQKPELFEEAYQLCMKQDGKISLRAARVVWLVSEDMPGLFKPYFPDMVRRLGHMTHSSVKRCMMKVLTVYDLSEEKDLHGLIIDACFGRMNDFGEDIATRAYAIRVLQRFVGIYPEISGEFMSALHMLIDNSKETLSRYSRKVLQELHMELR